MKVKRVLLLKTNVLCYGSTDYFIQCIKQELECMGIESDIVTLSDVRKNRGRITEQLEQKIYSAIISFNASFGKLREGDCFYFDYDEIPFYDYLLDHPLYHHETLMLPLKNLHVLCLDDNHTEYVRAYYPDVKSVTTLPLGAMAEKQPSPYEKRTMELLFTGTYTPSDKVESWMEQCSPGLQKEMQCIREVMLADVNLTQEAALSLFIHERNGNITPEQFREIMYLHFQLDTYIRALSRERVFNTLLDNRIKIHVVGHGWEQFQHPNKDCMIVKGEVDFVDSLNQMNDAKLVLNIMPWFKAGAHDRVFSSMLNGAVCVTDESSYMEKHFQKDKEYVAYDLKGLSALPERITELLEHPKKAIEIAEEGYQAVQKGHTWRRRMEQLFS
jgi:hypothetical protein